MTPWPPRSAWWHPTRGAGAVVIALALVSGPARADTFGTPPLKHGPPVSISAYGRQNPACEEWTNGCVLCAKIDGQARCSTPGIACTPAGITCKRLAR